jgi:FtsP/CotA-like multicopper oxidase with cupredoxin domain
MSELKSEKREDAGSLQEHETTGITVDRRTFVKTTAATGVVAVLTSRKSSVFAQSGPPAEPVLCGTTPPPSPPTTPFVDNLPVPFPAIPQSLDPAPTKSANIAGGEAARADHQRWEEFLPDVNYRLEGRAALHTFHRDLLPTYLWAFNGVYPAPTMLNRYGNPTLARIVNNLPQTTTSFGRNETTVHLHNGHTASESDGFAGDFFGTGLFKDNHYANAYAGIDAFGGNGDPREAMHTFWYHDHRAAFTANNNYLGLNGMHIAYDAADPGHEFAATGSLRLPGYYGVTDIPLILTDKRFCAAANGRNEAFQVVGAGAPAGDKWVVNGKILPKLTVRRRKYRFRILNTGPAKQWNLRLIKQNGTQATMTVVATDANFLESPFALSSGVLAVHVASRYDVIVDFSAFAAGSQVFLTEAATQNVGVPTPDPAPGLPIGNVVMRFDVVEREPWFPPDTPPVPGVLCEMPDPPVPDASFTWTFTLVNGRFLINGQEFDANRIDHVVLKGTTEEWTLANDVAAGNWLHPVHIHFEEGRIQSRRVRISQNPDVFQNVPLTFDELGRRDVYPLPPQNRVVLRQRFRDFVGRYLIHCHNMNHEDGFMMVRWDIVDSAQRLLTKRREIDERRRAAGLPPQYEGGLG